MNLPIATITTPHALETHAYHKLHVDVANTQIHRSIGTNSAFVEKEMLVATEQESISRTDRKQCDDTNSAWHCVDDSRESLERAFSDARDSMYSNNYQRAKNYNRQTTIGNNKTTIRALSNAHVYEEVGIKESRSGSYDMRDYYKKYSPATAKTLIDTLFLPRYTICRDCARMKGSPVYTDRLIYLKKMLFAVEIVLCQRDDVLCFKCRDTEDIFPSLSNQREDYMLVYSYVKTNAASIFYSHYSSRDVFDLQTLLRPSIHLLNRVYCNLSVNTQLYHRNINSYHVRTSRAGCAPMIFCHDTRMSSINYNDSQDPLMYQMHRLKNDGHRRARSSLLLLEPLLLMPESADFLSHQENTKHPTWRSEHIKIIKIIVAYLLSFLILASITFYIVYFT